MSSGYIPAKGEPCPDEILEALREAIFDNPRLAEMPSEEVARQLMFMNSLEGGHRAGHTYGAYLPSWAVAGSMPPTSLKASESMLS